MSSENKIDIKMHYTAESVSEINRSKGVISKNEKLSPGWEHNTKLEIESQSISMTDTVLDNWELN